MSLLNRVFSLFWAFFLHVPYVQPFSGLACSCTGIGKGCNMTLLYDSPDGNKNKENIALGKSAQMSTIFRNNSRYGNASSRQGCLAVNGFRDQHYVAYFDDPQNANCVQTDLQVNPTWTLDLGRKYTITSIRIYAQKLYSDRLQTASITVNNELCYKFNNTKIDEVTDINCFKPLTGRFIEISKSTTITKNYAEIISMCEFEVWVCKSGKYGQLCDKTCNSSCKDGCDNYNGSCLLKGCKDGFYGNDCSMQCGSCWRNVCESDGVCEFGCNPGWTGDRCNVTAAEKMRSTLAAVKELSRGALEIFVAIICTLFGITVIILILISTIRRRKRGENFRVSDHRRNARPSRHSDFEHRRFLRSSFAPIPGIYAMRTPSLEVQEMPAPTLQEENKTEEDEKSDNDSETIEPKQEKAPPKSAAKTVKKDSNSTSPSSTSSSPSSSSLEISD